MTAVKTERVDLNELVGGTEIECECMLCDLPLDEQHGPIEWRLTWSWPGPIPTAGTETMLLCDHCAREWVENPADFGGAAESMHRV